MQIDRQRKRLLRAAARFDSQSSGSDTVSDSDSESRGARKKSEHTKHSKKRKSKHSSKKSHKAHKKHKRSDHEKIAELEKRAAAMGAGSMLPSMGRMGFGRYSSTTTAASGDAVTLDTSGDANNALYESLYGGDLPRYTRMDPLDLVRVSRRLGWQLHGDADVGNTTADRYYRGRHYLQERSRSTKRINLSNLQPHQHINNRSMGLKPHSSSTLLLPPTTPLLPPGGKSGAAGTPGLAPAQQQQQHVGGSSSSRQLAIPAPAFIPLEAPQELLQQQEGGVPGDAGSWRQQQGSWQGKQRGIEPTDLVEQAGLSADEMLLQATRAWNIAVRERPHDEALWLEFAAFQHSAAQQQQQRGRAATTGLLDPVTAEKQISLLSRGLVHHPSSTALLLALLRCYAAVAPDADALEAKWAAVLARQGGSWELWREYIALRQCSFADFKVTGLLKVYQDALHSLQLELLSQRRRAAAAHKEQHKQLPQLTQEQQQQLTPLGAAAAAAATASSSALGLSITLNEEALELRLVQLLLGLLYVELEAGYTEQALAKMQALLEFHLFTPQLPPGGVPALLRLFAAYWSAGVPRIGEAGARGWAYWCLWHAMGMEQPKAAAAAAQEQAAADAAEAGPQQVDPAGWSGWFEVPQAASPPKQSGDSLTAAAAAAEGSQGSGDANEDAARKSLQRAQQESGAEGDGDSEGSESESEEGQAAAAAAAAAEEGKAEEELDEEELMQQLGLQLEQQLQEVERQGLPADVLARWVQEEASSCAAQWQPLRPDSHKTPATASPEPQPDATSPPDPARIATLDSVQPYLFLLRSNAALRRLVLGCVEMLGVPLGPHPWCSSNCPTPWQQQALHVTGDCAVGGLGSSSSGSSSRGSCWSDAAEQGGGVAGGTQQQQQQQRQRLCQQVPWYAASDERWQWAVNLLQRLAAGGPCGDWPELCEALMLMLASKPSDAAVTAITTAGAGVVAAKGDSASVQDSHIGQLAAAGGLQLLTVDGAAAAAAAAAAGGGGVKPSQQQLAAARAAAKQLLSDQQANLLLYDAYGCLEASAGQVKTARKVFETALSLATAAAAAAAGTGAGPAAGAAAQDSTPAAAVEAAARLAVHLAQLELTAGGAAGWAKAHVALHALLTKQQLQVSAAVEAAGISSSQGQQQPQQQQGGGLLADAQLRAARVKFQQQIPGLISSAGGFLTPAAASTIAAAALFELVVGLRRSEAAAGLDAAVAVCKQIGTAAPEAVRATSAQHEQLAVLQCHMLVAAATGSVRSLAPGLGLQDSSKGGGGSSSRSNASVDAALAASLAAAVPPSRAREALAAALQLYPHSRGLLQLQVALDHACLSLSGLRRQLASLLEMIPSPGLWAVALQAEALRPGGRVRLGVLFERALSAPTALQWHQQERLQRQRNTRAWDAACAGLAPPPRQPGQQEGQGRAQQQRQQLLQQPVTAQGRAAVLQDLPVWDGYRGWGHCEAGLWQQYIQHELELGRLDAARKLFLRAVHAMPGAKGLWLSGFGAVCAGMQPRECSGLLNVMQEREVLVRTDVYEVLLAAMAEKQL